MEKTNIKIKDLDCTLQKVYTAMGYGKTLPEKPIQELTLDLLSKAKEVVCACFNYQIYPCSVLLKQRQVELETILFNTQRTLTILLDKSEKIAVFAASVGPQFQVWLNEEKQKNDMIRVFILDSLGSVIVESVGDYMELLLEKEFQQLKHTNRFSPGYCGWDVSEQHQLFSLLPPAVCGITLHESAMMTPEKSISGFIGMGEAVQTKKYGCSICTNKHCYLRKK